MLRKELADAAGWFNRHMHQFGGNMETRFMPGASGGCAAAVVAMLLTGCAGSTGGAVAQQAASNAQTAATSAAAKTVADSAAASAAASTAKSDDRPGAAEGELVVVTAKVKAVDKKRRIVTLKYPDGKEVKVKCGPEVRNFAQIKVGDDVTAEFLETVELFVTAPQGEPTTNTAQAVERSPLGSKPGIVAVETVEVTSTVEAIDYATREVKLKGPEGKIMKVKAGPEVKRLNEVKKGDTVVARLTEAVSIKVSSPKK
jgi:Cu/Ag efflux protein CusF